MNRIDAGGHEADEAAKEIKLDDVIKSEPIKIVSTEYCFVWVYNIEEKQRGAILYYSTHNRQFNFMTMSDIMFFKSYNNYIINNVVFQIL